MGYFAENFIENLEEATKAQADRYAKKGSKITASDGDKYKKYISRDKAQKNNATIEDSIHRSHGHGWSSMENKANPGKDMMDDKTHPNAYVNGNQSLGRVKTEKHGQHNMSDEEERRHNIKKGIKAEERKRYDKIHGKGAYHNGETHGVKEGAEDMLESMFDELDEMI